MTNREGRYTFGGRLRPRQADQPGWDSLLELQNERTAFIYQRLSTTEQRERNPYSIEAQDSLADLARQDGYPNELICVERRDLGISGTKGPDEREGLAYLIRLIRADEVESIYVVDLSRLFRDQTLIEPLEFGELCKHHEVIIVTSSMRLNLRNRIHMRIYRMEVERAADELYVMKSRLLGPRELKAQQGRYAGGSIPPGYVLDTRKQIDGEPNPNYEKHRPFKPHAEIVNMLFHLAYLGNTPAQIFRHCSRQGIVWPQFPPELRTGPNLKGFSRLKSNPDGTWPITVGKIRSILQNPAYIGWWVWGGQVVSKNNHPPIVDKEVFWAVQEHFKSRPHRQKGDRQPLPLAGLLYCGKHNPPRRMIYSNGAQSGSGSYYRCGAQFDGSHCCKITAHILDDPICEAIISQVAYPELAERVLAELADEREQVKEQVASYRREAKRLEQEIENLRANLATRILEREELAWIDAEINQRRSRIKELAQLEAKAVRAASDKPAVTQEDVNLVREFLADLSIGWGDQPDGLKNAFLRLVMDRAIIWRNQARIRVKLIWRTGLEQEMVIQGPEKMRRHWTREELAVLEGYYETATIDELVAMLPGKTWRAITLRGNKLGLSRVRMTGGRGRRRKKLERWSEEEDQILRKLYAGEIASAEGLDKLKRSPSAIRRRAHRLGLKRGNPRLDWELRDQALTVTKGRQSRSPHCPSSSTISASSPS